MIYSSTITTPKNTQATSPVETFMRVTKGLVYQVEIDFPPGSYGNLYVKVLDGNYQVWPTTQTEEFRGNDRLISFDDTYLKESAPFEFKVITYNLDTAYDHIVIVRLGMASNEVFMARYLPTYTYKHFLEALDVLRKEQELARQAIIDDPFGRKGK